MAAGMGRARAWTLLVISLAKRVQLLQLRHVCPLPIIWEDWHFVFIQTAGTPHARPPARLLRASFCARSSACSHTTGRPPPQPAYCFTCCLSDQLESAQAVTSSETTQQHDGWLKLAHFLPKLWTLFENENFVLFLAINLDQLLRLTYLARRTATNSWHGLPASLPRMLGMQEALEIEESSCRPASRFGAVFLLRIVRH